MGIVHQMVRAGDVEGLRRELGAGAPVDELDKGGYTPLYYAVSCANPNPEVVRILLEAGADPGFVKIERLPGIFSELGDKAGDLLSKVGINLPSGFLQTASSERQEPLLRAALKRGNLEVIKLLHMHGADFAYKDKHGYTAILDAVYGVEERLPLIQYLISLGLDIKTETSYGESAVKSASHFGQFQVVAELLKAGADESILKWTPLLRAVSIGTIDAVKSELKHGPNLEDRDRWDRTSLHVALLKQDRTLAELLLAHGADLNAPGQSGASSLTYAIESGGTSLVGWLIELGCPVESRDNMDHTALYLAAELGDRDMVLTLLKLGADPNAKMKFGTVLGGAKDRETILLLLYHGANPGDLDGECRRKLLGLGEPDDETLNEVTHQQYLEARYPREGKANPEDMTGPFLLAMIRAGCSAYPAREHFGDPATFACGLKGQREPAVWCFQRFGQSTTILPDGRIVLIAGEHEDSYDPDFCIYNDVAVFDPDGETRIYGYPYAVFPPTDFHTATLVGDFIYIIGSLGYMDKRQGGMPIRRLSTLDFHIEAVTTTGVDPGRIYQHSAILVDQETIRIEGGTLISSKGAKEDFSSNERVFELDLRTLTWAAVR